MKKKHNIQQICLSFLSITILFFSMIIPSVLADPQLLDMTGFDKGISWQPMIPLKRTTLVNFDPYTYIDEYAYLAAIPTSIFYDTQSNRVFSNPLLFYQNTLTLDDNLRTLNARQGLDYFMEDWMNYCGGQLDQMTLINTPRQNLNNTWQARNYTNIQNESASGIASTLALSEWSYADEVVVATIHEAFPKPENRTSGVLKGSIEPEQGVLTEHFEIPKTNQQYPIYNEFTVPDGYKFLTVRSWYPCFYFSAGIPGFEGIINMSIPAGDRDMQIYCQENGQWMMAGITSEWNAQGGMDIDKTSVYVYKSGKWSVALTDVPTKSIGSSLLSQSPGELVDTTIEPQKHRKIFTFEFGRYGRILDILRNMRNVVYQVDINIYPGTMIEIPQTPPFGCRNATFSVSWDASDVALGLSLVGPSGEEILSTREPGVSSKCAAGLEDIIAYPEGTANDLTVERLGECLPDEHYSLCVFAMNELAGPVDFTITYSWNQTSTRMEGDCLASATEGAIVASLLNAPLLYVYPEEIPIGTLDALYMLGVKHLYLVDIGGYLSSNVKKQLATVAPLTQHFLTYDDVYAYIQGFTKRNDVIFSTVDSWSYGYVTNFSLAGEMHYALPIGPAAYIAAHHGSPVLILDNHPELSSAVVWHNELWRRHPDGFTKLPTVSEMYLTGNRVYDFLEKHQFDNEGEETIITVADQFEIGLSWDRMFVGRGKPGRFIGSPVDLSVWVTKNIFYPQIVFENPALKSSSGVTLINGSSSKRAGFLGLFTLWRGKLGLKITKPSQEETFQYPVLDTLVCYDHKFNSRASKYWGFIYECADGSIPGLTSSTEPIDDGVMVAVNGQKGGFLADLSGSEVQPFYLKRAGYAPVFSTNFDANMNNLNQGVLLWLVNTHGAPTNGGMLMFWDVQGENPNPGYPAIPLAGYKKETNPWRGYEWLMGSTEEPDTMTMEIHGILPALMGNPDPRGIRFFTTALDWAVARRPLRDIFGKIASLPGLRFIAPDWLEDTQDYYDGVIITVFLGRFGTSWYNGTQVDDALGNIHSTGISSVACLPAGKYLHLTLMRHGSVFQIMDPWATSWYSDVWQNSVPRGIALGKTIGEIYSEGIKKVGILYISEPPQWWWDLAENVCLYGDPDLRIWVPSTEYSSMNHWELTDVQPFRYNPDIGFSLQGHMPFGVGQYPHQKRPSTFWDIYSVYILLIVVFLLVFIAILIMRRRKK